MEENQEGQWHFAPAKVTEAAPSTEVLRSVLDDPESDDDIDKLQFNTAFPRSWFSQRPDQGAVRPREAIETLLSCGSLRAAHGRGTVEATWS